MYGKRRRLLWCSIVGAMMVFLVGLFFLVHELEKNDAQRRQDSWINFSPDNIIIKDGFHENKHVAPTLPLLFAVGQGTTGTHAMFEATCELGLPSVHFRMQCAPRTLSTATRRGIQHHLKLLELFDRIRRTCQQKYYVEDDECKFETLPGLVHDMKEQVTKVVNSSGGILAIHDSPYTNLLPHVLQTVVQSDRLLIIITSERDPTVWSKKRITDHPMEFVCREVFQQALEQPSSKNDDIDLPLGATFDMDQCLERALERRQEKKKRSSSSNTKLRYIQDVFVSYETLLEEAGNNETALEILFRTNELAMKHYQDHVVRHKLSPIYTINLWWDQSSSSSMHLKNNKRKTSAMEIAKEIKRAISKRQDSTLLLFPPGGSNEKLSYYKLGQRMEEL